MFTQNNNNYGQNGNGATTNAPKEKTNFPVGKIRGNGGRIETSCWKSKNNALYVSVTIRQEIGKNPDGRTSYEAGLAKDIPSVLFRADEARALYDYIMIEKPENLKFEKSPWEGSKIAFEGSDAGVKVTITDAKGTRTMTLPSIPVGNRNMHPNLNNFMFQFKTSIDAAVLYNASEEIVRTASTESGEPF